MGSQSGRSRSAWAQSGLSLRAWAAIVSAAVELTEGLDRRVDLLVAVRERREHALVLARCDVDPSLEQVAKELGVAGRVELAKRRHRPLTAEEREPRADALPAPQAGK